VILYAFTARSPIGSHEQFRVFFCLQYIYKHLQLAHPLVVTSNSVCFCPQYTEHLLLIGDHEQLRPKPNVYELQAESGR
jgi:hypothetical protein